jgi:hypothetical protein
MGHWPGRLARLQAQTLPTSSTKPKPPKRS